MCVDHICHKKSHHKELLIMYGTLGPVEQEEEPMGYMMVRLLNIIWNSPAFDWYFSATLRIVGLEIMYSWLF